METIQARVSKQLLAKASRLFTGTVTGTGGCRGTSSEGRIEGQLCINR